MFFMFYYSAPYLIMILVLKWKNTIMHIFGLESNVILYDLNRKLISDV